MSFFYEVPGLNGWAIMLLATFSLIAFNEFGRTTKRGGILLFALLDKYRTDWNQT